MKPKLSKNASPLKKIDYQLLSTNLSAGMLPVHTASLENKHLKNEIYMHMSTESFDKGGLDDSLYQVTSAREIEINLKKKNFEVGETKLN